MACQAQGNVPVIRRSPWPLASARGGSRRSQVRPSLIVGSLAATSDGGEHRIPPVHEPNDLQGTRGGGADLGHLLRRPAHGVGLRRPVEPHHHLRNWYGFEAFASHVRDGQFHAYAFIEPNHRPPIHTPDRRSGEVSNRQHPGNSIVPADAYDDGTIRRRATPRPLKPHRDGVRGPSGTPARVRKNPLLITYDAPGGLSIMCAAAVRAAGRTDGLVSAVAALCSTAGSPVRFRSAGTSSPGRGCPALLRPRDGVRHRRQSCEHSGHTPPAVSRQTRSADRSRRGRSNV